MILAHNLDRDDFGVFLAACASEGASNGNHASKQTFVSAYPKPSRQSQKLVKRAGDPHGLRLRSYPKSNIVS